MIELGLIGYPLGHSFSPAYFREKFSREKIDGSYELFPIEDISLLPRLLETHPALSGFNVTIPYKEAILPYLDEIDTVARKIGAVNTVFVQHDRSGKDGRPYRLAGYNTDWLGFFNSINPLLNHDGIVSRHSALILGTGGAAKAIACAFDNMGMDYAVASRHGGMSFAGHTTVPYSDIDGEYLRDRFVIVNCTPIGMYPNVDAAPPLPWDEMDGHHLCYDLVYNPVVTEFMRLAASRGAAVKNGLEMLHGQADAAWRIWTGSE